jgi:hypothetical protein
MNKFIDFLASMDLVDPIEGFISTFRYADWAGAYERRGIVGLVTELVASFSGHNAPLVWVQRGVGWSGVAVERLLTQRGIRVYGRGFAGNALCFRVKRRQARWAEYLMLRAGVPVVSAPVDARNIRWAKNARETRGAVVPARRRWSGKGKERPL